MPKVILVNPSNSTFGYSFIAPRWLYVIAQATPVDLVGDPVIIDESIEKFDPKIVEPGDIVGIGITTGNCIPGYRVLREAKKRGATVIMGGIHSTIFPEEPLEMGADSVITGGGDVVWGEAIWDTFEAKLRKLYVGGRVPGELLLPARWDLLDSKKYMFASVQTIAGCPENCSFCSVWVTEGRTPRQRLPEKIIAEANALYKMGFRYIIFADDNFNPATLGRIAREENASKRKSLERDREDRLRFFNEYGAAVPEDMYAFTQMTAELVHDPEYLKAMYDKMRIRAGLVGVESFDEVGLESANKKWNPVGQKMIEAIAEIQRQGIFVLSSIICGLETDTVATLKTMGEFAKNSGVLMAQFTLYSPFPGTVDFYEMMNDRKLRAEAGRRLLTSAKAGHALSTSSGLVVAPKHRMKILNDRFWLDPNKPVVLIDHPNMDSATLLSQVRKNWDAFYSLKEVIRRARAQQWPLRGKIWYVLASLGFKSLYAGYGLSADSVKNKKMASGPKLLMKLAIGFYNRVFRGK